MEIVLHMYCFDQEEDFENWGKEAADPRALCEIDIHLWYTRTKLISHPFAHNSIIITVPIIYGLLYLLCPPSKAPRTSPRALSCPPT